MNFTPVIIRMKIFLIVIDDDNCNNTTDDKLTDKTKLLIAATIIEMARMMIG